MLIVSREKSVTTDKPLDRPTDSHALLETSDSQLKTVCLSEESTVRKRESRVQKMLVKAWICQMSYPIFGFVPSVNSDWNLVRMAGAKGENPTCGEGDEGL